MSERKIIFETRVGSHLYGTNRPDSDEDFQGVFLPSKHDVLGMDSCPTEWSMNEKLSDGKQNTKGDVDRKFYSLKRFLHLAAEGQPGQIELLFAPPSMVISSDPLWQEILDAKGYLLSRHGIAPFIGFALAQAHKAVLKGDNLRLIRRIIEWYDTEICAARKNEAIKDFVVMQEVNPVVNERHGNLAHDICLKVITNKEGFTTVEIAGRNYDIGLKLKTFVSNLKEIENRFGERAQVAAENKYDYKSLMHAYRLMGEGKELLETGKITLPRPKDEVEFLLSVRSGTCGEIDHWMVLNERISYLRKVAEPNSCLPQEPDHSKINDLCMAMLERSIK